MEDNFTHHLIHDHPIFRNSVHLQSADKKITEPTDEHGGE